MVQQQVIVTDEDVFTVTEQNRGNYIHCEYVCHIMRQKHRKSSSPVTKWGNQGSVTIQWLERYHTTED